jgi:hypothetical protein
MPRFISSGDTGPDSDSNTEPGADHTGPGVNDCRQGGEGVMLAGPYEF